MRRISIVLAGAILSAAAPLQAASCKHPASDLSITATSAATTAIAELYTAEGCNSCPPADKWFSSLDDRKGGVIPLAYHVDYWDSDGWVDRFAKPAFSRRQRETVLRIGGKAVFTPQIMVNGREVLFYTPEKSRGSIYSRFNISVNAIVSRARRAELTLKATIVADNIDANLVVLLPAIADRADAVAYLAITENNLVSRVTAGENGGITLHHDHVVRELIGPLPFPDKVQTESRFEFRGSFALPRDWKRGDLSIVAFVQNQNSGDVYQALSSPVCSGD